MELWVQILIAFIAIMPGVLALIAQRKKVGADASSVQVDTSLKLLNEIQEQMKELKEEYVSLNKDYAALMKSDADKEQRIKDLERNEVSLRNLIKYYLEGIGKLTQQIEQKGDKPVWKPN